MEPEVEKPSFDDIRHALLSSIDHAEDFAFRYPDHADAVTRLLQEIRRIKKELMSSFEDSLRPSGLPSIVSELVYARVSATLMAERHPERSSPLSRFTDDLNLALQEFYRKVHPEL